MTDDYSGSATVAHRLAPHQPRDRHTDRDEVVTWVERETLGTGEGMIAELCMGD